MGKVGGVERVLWSFLGGWWRRVMAPLQGEGAYRNFIYTKTGTRRAGLWVVKLYERYHYIDGISILPNYLTQSALTGTTSCSRQSWSGSSFARAADRSF